MTYPLCVVVVKIVLIKESSCFNTAEGHGAARWILLPVFNALHHSLLDHLKTVNNMSARETNTLMIY